MMRNVSERPARAAEVVIVSDLHLCDGGPREDFLPPDETALAGLLDNLSRQTPLELIVNGDFVDFVQIQPRPDMWSGDTLDASEPESAEKLRIAIAAHASVFDTLARFVRRGGTLRFLYGNHDIDLVWPQVQHDLRIRLGRDSLDEHAIQFGWGYEIGGVFIEHGHQAAPPNRFADPRAVIHRDAIGAPRLSAPGEHVLSRNFTTR